MAVYLVTFDAEVYVEVEADDEFSAEDAARNKAGWQDVELLDAIDIDLVSGDE